MNVAKIVATALLMTMLCACSTMQTTRVSDVNVFEGASIQEIRDILGAPTKSETMTNGSKQDVFVFSDRILRTPRTSFGRCKNALGSTQTNGVPCEHRPESFRSATIICTVKAQYDLDGVISSVTAKPSGCATLQVTRSETDQA